LALTKERKNIVLEEYKEWLKGSEAIILTEYTGLSMPDMDKLRRSIREVGGSFHVIKNSLGKLAFDDAKLETPDDYFIGSTAIGFTEQDPASLAKAIKDFGKDNEAIKIKGGFMGNLLMDAVEINALADLPPLPVVRGQLLGVISAPASKLVRTLNEPGRSLAQLFKAKADAVPA